MGNQNNKDNDIQYHPLFHLDVMRDVFRFCDLDSTLELIMTCRDICNLFENDVLWLEWMNKHSYTVYIDKRCLSIKQGLRYNKIDTLNNCIKSSGISNAEPIISLFDKLLFKEIRKIVGTSRYTDIILDHNLIIKTNNGHLYIPSTLRIDFEFSEYNCRKTLIFPERELSPYFLGDMDNYLITDRLYWKSLQIYENKLVIKVDKLIGIISLDITSAEITLQFDKLIGIISLDITSAEITLQFDQFINSIHKSIC